MSSEQWRAIWERARSGQHTLLLGSCEVSSAPSDLHVLQINCATPLSTAGPLHEAKQQIDDLLGTALSAAGGSFAPISRAGAARMRVLEENAGRSFSNAFVESCNQLAEWDGGHAVLCFIAIDKADPATLHTLSRIINQPDWLRLPLIMLAENTKSNVLADLINSLLSQSGADAIVEMSADAPKPDKVFDWSALPAETLQVLRAGAVIGARFEATLIAQLLEMPTGRVLLLLQRAADAGVPLRDQERGYFALTAAATSELRDQLLPSLRSFWHQRLAELLGSQVLNQPIAENIAEDNLETTAVETDAVEEVATKQSDQTEPARRRFVDLFEPTLALSPEEPRDQAITEDTQQAAPEMPPPAAEPAAPPAKPAAGTQPDRARAAEHLQNSGQIEAAITQFLGAVHELSERGDAQRAYMMAQQAQQLLAKLPESERRALLNVELLLETGRLQWQSYAHDAYFTLTQALESLQAAAAALPENTPAELLTRLATTTAAVCYDLGDLDSLQQALYELTEVSRQLMAAGASLQAACLLSDQAAIYVRLGDPVRAAHLLDNALQLFEQLSADPAHQSLALAELAQVYHLYARLPLHAKIRPGRDKDAYAMALEHAGLAEANYRQLNQRRELARVWETMGRLELHRDNKEAAARRLTAAMTLQREQVDITGLARTSEALAELFAASGKMREALALLSDSVAFNHEKGSPIGLAFNRQTLAALAAILEQQQAGEDLLEQLAALQQKLAQAEARFGRVILPEPARASQGPS